MLKKILITLLEIALIALAVYLIVTGLNGVTLAEEYDQVFTAYVICQKDDYVNVRMYPSKKSEVVGRCDGGDEILTDGYEKNGFLRCYGFESVDAWIFSGYVVYDKPEWVNRIGYSVSRAVLNVRRFIGGKVIHKLKNLAEVVVYWLSDEWCVTNKGFVKTKYLEIEGT